MFLRKSELVDNCIDQNEKLSSEPWASSAIDKEVDRRVDNEEEVWEWQQD